ncbi:MAG TPA: HK97 gp10 family phage protein [Acidimicrobiales bacterium]|nr:HK97 gp10 family phage protein [Acidimicrobiales bacterium]
MAAPTVAIEGLKALRRDLIKLGEDDMVKAFVAAGQKVAEPLAGTIRSVLPSDSGDLAGTVRAAKIRTGAALRVGSKAVPYAGWVEFGGTRSRPHFSTRPFIKDGRYIFPAARQAGPGAAQAYSDEVERIIDSFRWTGPHD